MSLNMLLESCKERETVGSDVDTRYDYQKDLSLCLMLKHLRSNSIDFAALFEFHDDFVILDSVSHPKELLFYQIKTKETSHWLLTDLIRSKDTKFSILAKLYLNKINFSSFAKRLIFISNAKFSLSLESEENSGTKSTIYANELVQNEINKVNTALKKEHNLQANPSFEIDTVFESTELGLHESAKHTKGEIDEYIQSINPGARPSLTLAYNTIIAEIKKKGKYNLSKANNKEFGEIISKKGITRSQLINMLKIVGAYDDFEGKWSRIQTILNQNNVGFFESEELKEGWTKLQVELIDKPSNIVIKTLATAAIYSINNYRSNRSMYSLKLPDLLNSIYDDIKDTTGANLFDESFIKAVILKELNI